MSEKKADLDLLLACARRVLDGDGASRAAMAAECVEDWTAVAAEAEAHGVLPLLASHLTGELKDHVPGKVRDLLRRDLLRNAQAGTFLFQEATRLLRLFEENGLPAVPFKGPVMADRIFGDVALRPAGDLDFLMSRADADRGRGLLLGKGYRPFFELTPRQERAYGGYYYAHTLFRERNRVTVDLHWELSRRFFPRTIAGFGYRERLVSLTLGEGSVQVLAAEDLLLLLCLHGAKHRWERLIWIVDVAELIRSQGGMDWGLVLSRARRLHVTRALSTGLGLARNLLGVELPAAAESVESKALVEGLTGAMMEGLTATAKRTSLAAAAEDGSFQLRVMDRWRDRLRFCLLWACLPNINDWRWVKLPDALYPLYYLLRPLRMGSDVIKNKWGPYLLDPFSGK
jgi:hypothetical protein